VLDVPVVSIDEAKKIARISDLDLFDHSDDLRFFREKRDVFENVALATDWVSDLVLAW
jgi:hypothetical protein